jgi:PKD repeat protein
MPFEAYDSLFNEHRQITIQGNFSSISERLCTLVGLQGKPSTLGTCYRAMKHFFTLALLGLLATQVNGQQNEGHFSCHTGGEAFNASLHGNDPDLMQAIADEQQALDEFTREFAMNGSARATHVIPVVFHIIHNNGPENISDAQILDQMRILNEDFSRTNPDWDNVKAEFLGIVADVDVEFRLARKDPQGNCTSGITRTVSTLTNVGDQSMKALIQWPRNRYLNIWVSASANGAAGYALLPAAAQWLATQDGIVLQHTYVGSIGTGIPQRSRALTHEVGHWINLPHTWGNSNTPGLAGNCNEDDGVSDTPNTQGWVSCNLNGTTCGTLDNVENYMDYSYCSKMFTEGQKTRMIASLNSTTAQRNQLSQASNLTATGVSGAPQLCAVAFSSDVKDVCAGNSVTFTDASYHGVASRTWTFEGGTPATSTAANPTVVYNQPGSYSVTLSASDGTNSLSTTSQNYINVNPSTGTWVPALDGFEAYSSLATSPWRVENPNNNNTFELTNTAAYSGSSSVRLVNATNMSGQMDDLVSTTYNMTGVPAITLTFRYAFARRSASNDDRLRIFVTNNCGETWSLRQQLRGSTNLTTGGNTTASFVPNQDQWGYAEVTNISNAYHVSDFRFKFEFESAGGNNLYIDDINLNGASVGLEEVMAGDATALIVVPNPATDEARVIVNLRDTGRATVELLDVLGRRIQVLHDGQLVQGGHRFDIPVNTLQSGMYFIRLQQGGTNKVERFVVR